QDVFAFNVAKIAQTLTEVIPNRLIIDDADGRELRRPLRPCGKRPRGRCAAEQRDEIATPDHSITSSASCWRCSGTSRPSTLAVCRLMTNSNLVACTTGRLAGFAPFRIRPVYNPT